MYTKRFALGKILYDFHFNSEMANFLGNNNFKNERIIRNTFVDVEGS